MKIVADDAIPYVNEAFSRFGEITLLPGRAIKPEAVKNAEVLLTRAVTKVDESLLEGSQIRFVGTATIGTDHIDEAYLTRRGITLVSAKGCNADAVAQYIATAIYSCSIEHGLDPALSRRVGVVGFGNIGRRLTRLLRALGREVWVCDPPIAAAVSEGRYSADSSELGKMPLAERFYPIDELVHECGIITAHVPLHHEEHSTYHLFNRARLTTFLRSGGLLLNTSRGPVVDNTALSQISDGPCSGRVVLDVWEGEPALRWELLDPDRAAVVYATQHIAGYSLEGKLTGTRMLHEALAAFLHSRVTWSPDPLLGPRGAAVMDLNTQGAPSSMAALCRYMRASCAIDKDDRALRALLHMPEEMRPTAFDQLRRDYEFRRQFEHYRVSLPERFADIAPLLGTLGFTLA